MNTSTLSVGHEVSVWWKIQHLEGPHWCAVLGDEDETRLEVPSWDRTNFFGISMTQQSLDSSSVVHVHDRTWLSMSFVWSLFSSSSQFGLKAKDHYWSDYAAPFRKCFSTICCSWRSRSNQTHHNTKCIKTPNPTRGCSFLLRLSWNLGIFFFAVRLSSPLGLICRTAPTDSGPQLERSCSIFLLSRQSWGGSPVSLLYVMQIHIFCKGLTVRL